MAGEISLILTPQPEGGFTVTSPVLPKLVTEGDSVSEALANAQDALAAVIELYQESGLATARYTACPMTYRAMSACVANHTPLCERMCRISSSRTLMRERWPMMCGCMVSRNRPRSA